MWVILEQFSQPIQTIRPHRRLEVVQMTQKGLHTTHSYTKNRLTHTSLTSKPSFLFPVGCWVLRVSCEGTTMLCDLKLTFVAFSGGRFPFPNLFLRLGKSDAFPDRLFPLVLVMVPRGNL